MEDYLPCLFVIFAAIEIIIFPFSAQSINNGRIFVL